MLSYERGIFISDKSIHKRTKTFSDDDNFGCPVQRSDFQEMTLEKAYGFEDPRLR